jgi:hypothetical protein
MIVSAESTFTWSEFSKDAYHRQVMNIGGQGDVHRCSGLGGQNRV